MTDKNIHQLAVITGGASGIGLSAVKRFLNEGYKVLILDANKDAGEEAVKNLKSDTCDVNFTHCDITNHTQIETIFQDLLANNQPVHVLVNCAGISPALSPLHQYPVEEWHRTIDINLHGTFYACREFCKLAKMQKIDKGAIVNVASIMGVRASAAQAPYAASKHAVVGLTKSIAQDYATINIRANAIGPGVIDTPMNTELMKDDNIMQYMLQRIPMNRVATSDEVANLIYFLASSEASYITGSYFPVDGGYLAS
jgi:NAD(P)-dependent dehydrogenase (short-subunit alcohol dehydrogenase family)